MGRDKDYLEVAIDKLAKDKSVRARAIVTVDARYY